MAQTQFSQEGYEVEPEIHDGQQVAQGQAKVYSTEEAILEYLRGIDVQVYAEDVHGNNRSQRFRIRQPLGTWIADETAVRVGAEVGGLATGFTQGAAELPDFALMLSRQPRETGASLAELSNQIAQAEICADRVVPSAGYTSAELREQRYPCDYLANETEGEVPDSRGEFWVELAYSMEDALHEDQHRSNPFDFEGDAESGRERFTHCLTEYNGSTYQLALEEQSEEIDLQELPFHTDGRYCDYAAGWYQGYALFAVVETVAGTKGTVKGASTAEEATDAIEAAGRQLDEGVLRSTARNAEAPTPRVKRQVLADGGRELDGLPDNLRSSGKTVGARQAFDAVDDAVLDTLEPAQRTELLRHLGENPEGHKFVDELRPEDADWLFSDAYRYDQTPQRLFKAVDDGAISDADAARLAGDMRELAREDGIDATGVLARNDEFSQRLIREYSNPSVVDKSSLRKMAELEEVALPDAQVQSKFKHADDFGVKGNWNKQNKQQYKRALRSHILDPDTKIIEGTYRSNEVTHLYNPTNGNNVMLDPDGEFVSGWKLNDEQADHLTNTGDL